LALSPDDRYLAWYGSSVVPARRGGVRGTQRHDTRVWSIQGRRQVARLPIEEWATALAFSPDGRLLAVSCRSGAVQLWDTKAWERRAVLGTLDKEGDAATGLSFCRDGKSLAVAHYDRKVRVWDLATRRPRVVGEVPYYARQVSFSPDGHFVAAADVAGNIKAWEVAPGKEHWSFRAHVHPRTKRVGVQGIAFLPDGTTLVTAGTDGMVRVWGVPGKKEIRHFDGKVGEVDALALSPDGKMVALTGSARWSAPKPGGVRTLDVATGKQLGERGLLDHEVSCLCFSRDGKGLAVGACGLQEGKIYFWNVAELCGLK
jgi:WD40 repeat protein